ncbi:MAG: hypothetical protein HYV63_26200 [Candidatus Schekmanbacteria bacterium]|nr:hypothetical protein [Candidatus Schekmanbacteria bacterium]
MGDGIRKLFLLFLAVVLLGVAVLILKGEGFTEATNLESNKNYYPDPAARPAAVSAPAPTPAKR